LEKTFDFTLLFSLNQTQSNFALLTDVTHPNDIFDLYTDYLITSFSYTTATGLSGLVDNAISHDPVTRFLSQQDFTSKELGKVIKQTVREIETGEGVLIFDDTLQEKPHSKENDLICWHYDHCVNRSG
jgi:hypothetical protein